MLNYTGFPSRLICVGHSTRELAAECTGGIPKICIGVRISSLLHTSGHNQHHRPRYTPPSIIYIISDGPRKRHRALFKENFTPTFQILAGWLVMSNTHSNLVCRTPPYLESCRACRFRWPLMCVSESVIDVLDYLKSRGRAVK